MGEPRELTNARRCLARAEADLRAPDGLTQLVEGLALLEDVIGTGSATAAKTARNLATSYAGRIYGRIGELIADAPSLPDAVARISGQDDAFFSHRFLAPRPLLQAIESVDPVVLLVDEIDKAEPEFEAFLLEVLSDFQVSVPELGTIRATQIPLVVLTSNNARELSDGLKRRCLHLFIDFPPPDEELAIIRLKVPEISDRLARTVVTAVQRIRTLELRKAPSVSESLDWARSLVILNAASLDRDLVESTLTMLVKHEKDLDRVKGALDKVLADLG